MASKLILSQGASFFRPVVLTVQLSPQESQAVLRHTGVNVTKIEFTEAELKALVLAGSELFRGKHYDI